MKFRAFVELEIEATRDEAVSPRFRDGVQSILTQCLALRGLYGRSIVQSAQVIMVVPEVPNAG
jgi:hypothetical protein